MRRAKTPDPSSSAERHPNCLAHPRSLSLGMNSIESPIDRWFASYSRDHQNPTNQRLHVVCVPAIFWSVIALLWTVPGPITGLWAVIAMAAALAFYMRLSPRLGVGMLATSLACAALASALHGALGAPGLAAVAGGCFAAAWVGQFVGHKLEGRKPSFLTDVTYLLIGPGWVMAKVYRKVGVGWR